MVAEKGLGKLENKTTQMTEDHTEDVDEQFINTDGPFPEVPGTPVEEQLTVRAALLGCILGAVIAASNIYLGLKIC
ncbi:hypothetical protein BS17DRAFT_773220 [Gyrodon lividus]|nr:hypothetical protein BS17DRAFT_773220 [Gyrodon lividus]